MSRIPFLPNRIVEHIWEILLAFHEPKILLLGIPNLHLLWSFLVYKYVTVIAQCQGFMTVNRPNTRTRLVYYSHKLLATYRYYCLASWLLQLSNHAVCYQHLLIWWHSTTTPHSTKNVHQYSMLLCVIRPWTRHPSFMENGHVPLWNYQANFL